MSSAQERPTAESLRVRVTTLNDKICKGIENGVIAQVMRDIRMELVSIS